MFRQPIRRAADDEMALFVKAGLTPMEALRAATRNPAQYLGLLESLDTVERGKIADLVLVDANPLGDIRNTQKDQRRDHQRPPTEEGGARRSAGAGGGGGQK